MSSWMRLSCVRRSCVSRDMWSSSRWEKPAQVLQCKVIRDSILDMFRGLFSDVPHWAVITDFDLTFISFIENPQISRDGKRFAYSRGRISSDIWLMTLQNKV